MKVLDKSPNRRFVLYCSVLNNPCFLASSPFIFPFSKKRKKSKKQTYSLFRMFSLCSTITWVFVFLFFRISCARKFLSCFPCLVSKQNKKKKNKSVSITYICWLRHSCLTLNFICWFRTLLMRYALQTIVSCILFDVLVMISMSIIIEI